MPPGAVSVERGGEQLVLLPHRALWLPAHHSLLVADAHLGKAVSFRRLGVPVPEATTDGTLQRLHDALVATGARRLIFLGDLLHSARVRTSATLDAVQRWLEGQAGLQLTLVRGNHDRQFGDPPTAWGVESVDEPLRLGGLALMHHPREVPGAYALAGHLHPGAVLGGRARDRLRLPCFHFGPALAVLPAFGEFTGLQVLQRAVDDHVYVVQGGQVRPVGVVRAAGAPGPASL